MECVWGGSAPRSVFVEGGVKAGGLDVALDGHDPQRAGPHPGVLKFHIKPLTERLGLAAATCDGGTGHRAGAAVAEVCCLRAAARIGERHPERRTAALLYLDTAVVTDKNRLSSHRYSSRRPERFTFK